MVIQQGGDGGAAQGRGGGESSPRGGGPPGRAPNATADGTSRQAGPGEQGEVLY